MGQVSRSASTNLHRETTTPPPPPLPSPFPCDASYPWLHEEAIKVQLEYFATSEPGSPIASASDLSKSDVVVQTFTYTYPYNAS